MRHIQCAPIQGWDGQYRTRRQRSQFSATIGKTLKLLDAELGHLNATNITLELDITPDAIRNDGWPRASAKVPPPVRLSFTSKHGAMSLATDRYDHWSDNVRAIALGLEALRKIERYGIADSAQQYAGWSALPAAGDSSGRSNMQILADAAGFTMSQAEATPLRGLVRRAKANSHPDAGGTSEFFNEVTRAADALDATNQKIIGSPDAAAGRDE